MHRKLTKLLFTSLFGLSLAATGCGDDGGGTGTGGSPGAGGVGGGGSGAGGAGGLGIDGPSAAGGSPDVGAGGAIDAGSAGGAGGVEIDGPSAVGGSLDVGAGGTIDGGGGIDAASGGGAGGGIDGGPGGAGGLDGGPVIDLAPSGTGGVAIDGGLDAPVTTGGTGGGGTTGAGGAAGGVGSCCTNPVIYEPTQISSTRFAVDSQCNVRYYNDNGIEKRLYTVAPDGTRTSFATDAQIATLNGEGLHALYAGAGDVLYATTPSSVVQFDGSGNPTAFYSDGATLGFQSPDYMSMDANGDFYVSDFMGGHPRIYKVTAAGTGSTLVTPSGDPTGVGSNAVLANGDILYIASKLMRVPAGTSTEEPYIPDSDVTTKIMAVHDANDGPIPSGAINVKAQFFGDTFGIDANENVYVAGYVQYVSNSSGSYATYQYNYLLKVTPSKDVSLLFSLGQSTVTSNLASNLVVKNGVLFYYQYSAKNQIRCYALP
jgi:hypothetical protein